MMTDCFALLGEPRRPWLDPEALKARFLTLSAEAHPDRAHASGGAAAQVATERFTTLNAAYQRLREPKDRLAHLLELELGAKPKDVQRLPAGAADLFMEVAQLCREVDAFLEARGKLSSPILRARSFADAVALTDRVIAAQGRVEGRREQLVAETRDLNPVWDAAPAVGSPARRRSLPLERLEQLYRSLSYVGRWSGQLQERLARLAMGAAEHLTGH